MKIISREEFNRMSVARPGRRHPLSDAIEQLEVGQLLHIPSSDWTNTERSPQYLVTRAAKKLGRQFTFYRLTDARAWVVERVG